MTPEQFAYWLAGFVELTRGRSPDPAQWKSICEHLNTLFNKVTPVVGERDEPKQAEDPAQKLTRELQEGAQPPITTSPAFPAYPVQWGKRDFPPGKIIRLSPDGTFPLEHIWR